MEMLKVSINEFKKMKGWVGSIIDLSNKLQALGCEDICDFGNWDEILDSGNVVISTDEFGEEHIQIFFKVEYEAGKDEVVEATYIKIKEIEAF